MAVMSKYRGLCETCDHDAICTMKRSPRLEIIQCEQFSTQPVMHRQAVSQGESSPSDSPRNHGIATCGAKRLADEFVDPSCGSGLSVRASGLKAGPTKAEC